MKNAVGVNAIAGRGIALRHFFVSTALNRRNRIVPPVAFSTGGVYNRERKHTIERPGCSGIFWKGMDWICGIIGNACSKKGCCYLPGAAA